MRRATKVKRYLDFKNAMLFFDASDGHIKEEKKKQIGLLTKLKLKLEQFKNNLTARKLLGVVKKLLVLFAGASISTAMFVRGKQIVEGYKGTFLEFINERKPDGKPLFPLPVRVLVKSTYYSLVLFMKLLGIHNKSKEVINEAKSASVSSTNVDPTASTSKGQKQFRQPDWFKLNHGDPERQKAKENRSILRTQLTTEAGGVLDTIFKNTSREVTACLGSIQNDNEIKKAGIDLSFAIKDVKDALDSASKKITDYHFRVTQHMRGNTIAKDLQEAQMRVARIGFILRQKGVDSAAAESAQRTAQSLIKKMISASERMKPGNNDSAIKDSSILNRYIDYAILREIKRCRRLRAYYQNPF